MLNPVFRRETRTVLRTWKTFFAITGYVILLAAVSGLLLLVLLGETFYNGFNPQNTTAIYTLSAAFQLGLVILVVPALTGGAISGERERQTLDLMLVTKMSTFSIVFGKLVSSLLVVLLMIFASIPVFGVVLYYGGVNLINILTVSMFTLSIAAMVGSISIFFSTVFKKTVLSIILTYIVMIILSLGTIIFVYFTTNLLLSYTNIKSIPNLFNYISYLGNPFVAFLSVVDSQLGTTASTQFLENYNYLGSSQKMNLPPFWVLNLAFNFVVICIFTFLSSIFVKPARKSKKFK